MKLSDAERWILLNQYKILDAITGAESVESRTCKEILSGGYGIHYDKVSELHHDVLSEDDCWEVLHILEMFRVIDSSIKKENVDVTELKYLKFQGFDGNEEPRQLNYADFYCNRFFDSPKYIELRDNCVNSHSPRLGVYRRMLEVYETVKPDFASAFTVTKDALAQINAAAVHPDQR
ncbi:YfbU family protein [Planctomicrobium sp. SH527]|uniref:YfbU family protein n=1 Tax=Planctomicrobium sp. SH527 TaxID=3448123 RepID=UPI003F5AF907